MRSLAALLQRERPSVAVRNPREAQLLFRLLGELGLEGVVSVGSHGVEVPHRVLETGDPAALACWLASLVERGEVVVGVDMGAANIGVAVIVGGVLAYTDVMRSAELLSQRLLNLAELGFRVRVRIGCPAHLSETARSLVEALERTGIGVDVIRDERVKDAVILGDFTILEKLSKHEVDAIKIALAGAGGNRH